VSAYPRSLDQRTRTIRITNTAMMPAETNFCWYILQSRILVSIHYGQRKARMEAQPEVGIKTHLNSIFLSVPAALSILESACVSCSCQLRSQ
jgi:hypothetical protein